MKKEQIGNATLYQGDCREILESLDFDALVTDPPYGVNLGNHKASLDKRKKHLNKPGYLSYEDTEENLLSTVVPVIEKAVQKCNRGMVFCAGQHIWKFPRANVIGGVYLPAPCGRNSWGFASMSYVLFYGKNPNLQKGCRPTGISSTEASEKNGHPTPKPIGWMKWLVNLGTSENETVLDPFMGSGTTGVACHMLRRKFIGIELEPKYFDLACQRITEAQKQISLFDEPHVQESMAL